jgi:hypothetical protein
MPNPEPDPRSERRKTLDEQFAAEPHLPLPEISPSDQPRPMEPASPGGRCRGGGERVSART